MLKPVLLLAALFAAPALAQTGAAPPAGQAGATPPPTAQPAMPPPAFMTAAQAFGRCLGSKSLAAPATATPEAAAHTAVVGCQTEKTALDGQFASWVAGPTFPAQGRDTARAQYAAQMSGIEAQIASSLRQKRAQPAAPAPAPAPSATATPRR